MGRRKSFSQKTSNWFKSIMAMCLILQLLTACSHANRKVIRSIELSDFAEQYQSARTDRERYLIMKKVVCNIQSDSSVRHLRCAPVAIGRNEFILAFGRPDRERSMRIEYDYLIDCARLFSVWIGFDATGKSTVAVAHSAGWGGAETDISEIEDRDAWMQLFGGDYYIVISKIWINPFKLEDATLSEVCSFIMGKVNPRLEAIGCKGVDISVKDEDGRMFNFESRGGCVQSIIKEIEIFMGYSATNNFGELLLQPEMSPSVVFHNRRHALHFNESE